MQSRNLPVHANRKNMITYLGASGCIGLILAWPYCYYKFI